MAQTTTWKIHDMQRDASTGGVKTIYWECRVTDNDNADCSAVEGGKLRLTPDASASDFVAYDDLTETTVLGWVYNSLIEDDETAAEAKARIETNRQGKVTAQVARKTAEAPAALFQIKERGAIKEGYFADAVIVDLQAAWTVTKENILYKCQWSPFEGEQFDAQILQTFVNGHLAFDKGVFNENQLGKRLRFNRN